MGRQEGAEFRGEVAVEGLVDGKLKVRDGEDIDARQYVDASGLNGTLLKQTAVKQTDLCSAAQQNREVLNREQALSSSASTEPPKTRPCPSPGSPAATRSSTRGLIGDEVAIASPEAFLRMDTRLAANCRRLRHGAIVDRAREPRRTLRTPTSPTSQSTGDRSQSL